MRVFGTRGFLGGVDPSSPLSPHYGESRFDAINSSLRRRAGGGIRHRQATDAPSPTQRKKPSRKGQSAALVPFGAASHEHGEGPFADVAFTPGANAVNLLTGSAGDIPSHGFLRGVWILVTTSGGTVGSAALDEDAPFNVFDTITLKDVNGAPIYGPLTGFQAFVANLFGGYGFFQDPRQAPFHNTGAITFSFALWIPTEIHNNNGLGSLANQNAAAPYKLELRGNAQNEIWTTLPTANPSVRVRCFLETWQLPDRTDRAGRPQAQLPPLHGTTQFWSAANDSVLAGRDQIKINRTGNLFRTLILICRVSGARSNAVLPEVYELYWDQRIAVQEHRDRRRQKMAEQYLMTAAGIPTGVFAWTFDDDVLGHAGNGTPEKWIPTVQSSRIEFVGQWAAGDLDIMLNDIAPVEVDQARRFVETSETGFEPAV